jgi:hypothetical protein
MKELLESVLALTTGLMVSMVTVAGVTAAVCGGAAGCGMWWRNKRRRSKAKA